MLEATNIHKTFSFGAKSVAVLKGVNLRLDQGEFAAIIGPSGAGKTTLLNILGGLDEPTDGRISFAGEDIYRLQDKTISQFRNQKVGFVFQFYHLLSEFTVVENVLMPMLIGSAKASLRQQLRREALGFLEQFGLSERLTHFPAQLSGGERQRVAIVRALINKPSLLLCDEPTGNLDSKTGSEIMGLIKKINTQNRMSVILVTHNEEFARIADCVYHLQDGILVN